jgi:hypothetical protein
MHENCPICGLKYEREVGFWWGAMYVAYTFSSGALLIVMLVTMLVLKWELPAVFTAVGITALIGFTYNARLARSTWINLVVHYNPNWKQEAEQQSDEIASKTVSTPATS